MAREWNRGQAAAGAAVLLAVIAALLIMFVILIPPSERAELLGEDGGTTGTSPAKKVAEPITEKNLLTEAPGKIDYLAQRELEHPLPVATIFTETEAKVLAEKPLVQVKKSTFGKASSPFVFTLSNPDLTENLLLSYVVVRASGDLIISLDGEEIFSAEATEGSAASINLPKNLLRPENRLEFTVSSPGLAFWRTNEIVLERLQIIGEVTSLAAQSSRNIFLISDTEKRNLEKVVLKFQPQCNVEQVGKLTVRVNGNEIYDGIPDCELELVPIEFSSGMVHAGENELVFRTEKGTYLLSHVMVKSELKEVDYPTYYFELSNEDYTKIKDGKLKAILRLDFVEVVDSKFGDLVFNGKVKHFDTREPVLTLDLTEDVVQGNNALKIKPRKTLEVRQLRMDLVKG